MQSRVLALVLILAAGPALAAGTDATTDAKPLPPIPAPSEATTPVAPLLGPWPAPPADAAVAMSLLDESGAARTVPPIPAPTPPSASPEPTPVEVARPAFDPRGTVHVVETGDTLWDISDLYLGTPWIWPSIWRDNDDIENPHLILPGDKIWVSATEMRKLTDEEAAALLAGQAEAPAPAPAALAEDVPAVPMPQRPREIFDYAERSTVGIVSRRELKGAARIVGTTAEQIYLSQGDVVFIDLGEEEVAPGDRFTIFRTSEKVYDPTTRSVLGYHSEILGWLEITEAHGSTARGLVRQSYAEFIPGVYLRPREPVMTQIAILESPEGVEGRIADLLVEPKYRGGGDVIVLNRGSKHGLQVGSPLEVYRTVDRTWKKTWYGPKPYVKIPHEVVAQLVVLSVEPRTAMAYVQTATTELWYGDRFRTVGGPSVTYRGSLLTLPLKLVRWASEVPARVGDKLPNVPVPVVPMPETVAGWNVPRLHLPELDGYDPR